MSAASSSTSPNGTEQCKVVIDGTLFDLGCLGPALAIILILAFLERRTKFKLDYCDGRPGLLVPFDFLGSLSNRYTIAITFGATASKCLLLFLQQEKGIFVLPGPQWLKVFQDLVSVLVYGILFYPFFACLTTNYKFIGSLLGFLYGAIRFSIGLVVNYQCLPEIHEVSKKLGLLWLAKVPTYLCLLFIVMRFAVLFYLAVKKKWLWLPSEREEDHSSSRKLVAKPEIIHVKHLLRQGSELEGAQDEWYLRLRNYFYKPRPDFKFSTQLFSTLLVAAIALFQLFVAILVVTELGREVLNSTNRGVSDQDVTLRGLYRVAIDGVELGVIVAAIVSVLMMLHFMKSHRDHVLQLYRGQSKFAQGVVVSPARLMGRSLCFCGYQIAYIVAGFILLASILSLIGLCLAFVFKFADQLFPVFAQYREAVLQTLLPPFCMAIFVWLFQLFLGYFVFRDRDFPNITITVDNRRLYSILSYFFFFFNVILGIFSVAMRLFKGMLLGIIFVSRIDRTSLMYGFQAWDRAFVAYLGFLHVLVAHRHPVLLTFCQLLIDRNSEKPLGEPLEERPPSTSIQRSYAQEPGVPTEVRLLPLSRSAGYGGTCEVSKRITTTSITLYRGDSSALLQTVTGNKRFSLPLLLGAITFLIKIDEVTKVFF